MAEELEVGIIRTPTRNCEVDKENSTPGSNMKTSTKLSNISPFVKSGSKGFKIMSDEEIALSGQKKQHGTTKNSLQKRRSLATLQPSSDGKGRLTGNGRELSIKEAFKRKKDIKHSSNLTKIDVKTSPPNDTNMSDNKSVIKDQAADDQLLIDEALELMTKTEKADDSYWKKMAEERREALEETLRENEKLYNEIDTLTVENENLKQQLSNAECYKILYQNLLASQDNQAIEKPEDAEPSSH